MGRCLTRTGISALAALVAFARVAVAQVPARPNPPAPADVRVEVNAVAVHQVMEGFGALTGPVGSSGSGAAAGSPAWRSGVVDAAFGDVRLTLAAVGLGQFEPANDDIDPQYLSQGALDLSALRAATERLVVPARVFGADALFPRTEVGPFAVEWLTPLRTARGPRYADESAEHIVAAVLKWRDVTGEIPRFQILSSQPIDDTALRDSSRAEMIEIIKRAGARLRGAGMPTKLVVPSDDSATLSAALARAILADVRAREYVGAIGYRVPSGSAYGSMARILEGAGAGRRDGTAIIARRVLRDLGRQHTVAVWAMGVPIGDLDPRGMDALRARAIQIHDELSFADAAAYFAELAASESRPSGESTGSGQRRGDASDPIVLIEPGASSIAIAGTGYAIGHYARWVSRGAFRVEASSSDPLVMATAFVDYRRGRVSFVIVNNADAARSIRVHLGRVTFAGPLRGEQSYETVRWKALGDIGLEGGAKDAFVVTVPAKSVTSLGGPI